MNVEAWITKTSRGDYVLMMKPIGDPDRPHIPPARVPTRVPISGITIDRLFKAGISYRVDRKPKEIRHPKPPLRGAS